LSVTIVKLGGSLAYSPQREAWLATLAGWGGPLILVPGGGPFAQGVRAAQKAIGFDDNAAHRMALLAMEQFAVLLGTYSDVFAFAKSCRAMDEALGRGKIPVWLPSDMVLGSPDVPASWDVTSDSLAAWLAKACGARRLLLIKSCDPVAPVSACRLAADHIVDPLFPGFAAQSQADIWIAGPAALAGACDLLRHGGMPGAAVTLSDVRQPKSW
jgi:aspartokinase-like uncharacterized kinase